MSMTMTLTNKGTPVNKSLLFFTLALLAGTAHADGVTVARERCMACHIIDGEGGDKQAAPPMYGAWHHYRVDYPERGAFVAAVVAWLDAPAAERALMQGAVKRFGVMERVALTTEEAQAVAGYLWERSLDVPEAYVAHYNEQHGQPSHGYERPVAK